MSTNSHSVMKGDFLKSKHMSCILVFLITLVLFLIYMSWNSSSEADLCGCGSQEGLNYAKKMKEGIQSNDCSKYQSPALRSMCEKGKEGIQYATRTKTPQEYLQHQQSKINTADQFDVMKTRTVKKAIDTKTMEGFVSRREGFSNDFIPPQVLRSSGAQVASPFFGPISL